jgi:hypothetical protein
LIILFIVDTDRYHIVNFSTDVVAEADDASRDFLFWRRKEETQATALFSLVVDDDVISKQKMKEKIDIMHSARLPLLVAVIVIIRQHPIT